MPSSTSSSEISSTPSTSTLPSSTSSSEVSSTLSSSSSLSSTAISTPLLPTTTPTDTPITTPLTTASPLSEAPIPTTTAPETPTTEPVQPAPTTSPVPPASCFDSTGNCVPGALCCNDTQHFSICVPENGGRSREVFFGSTAAGTYCDASFTPNKIRADNLGNCSNDGQYSCQGEDVILVCDQGGLVKLSDVAAGTKCVDGTIVADD